MKPPREREASDIPLRVLCNIVHANAMRGAESRPGGELADSEVNVILRWALRTVADWVSTTRACAGMSDRAHQQEMLDVMEDYELLTYALQGRVVLTLDGGRVIGMQRTRAERAGLVDWLA